MDAGDIEGRLRVAKQAAALGGRKLGRLFGLSAEELQSESKAEDGMTPRTVIDLSVGGVIADLIQQHCPDDTRTDEDVEGSVGQSGWHWWVDPFDGTSNAAPQFRNSTVGIAASFDGEMQIGVIADPFDPFGGPKGTLTFATKGGGAWMEDMGQTVDAPTRIQVIRGRVWNERFVTVDALWNPMTAWRKAQFLQPLGMMLTMNVRMFGSNILGWSLVAQGRVEAHLMDAVGGFWDTAPGLVIVPEAGGLIVNIEGKTPTADDHVVLATNGEEDLHEDLCGLMFDCYQGYDGFR